MRTQILSQILTQNEQTNFIFPHFTFTGYILRNAYYFFGTSLLMKNCTVFHNFPPPFWLYHYIDGTTSPIADLASVLPKIHNWIIKLTTCIAFTWISQQNLDEKPFLYHALSKLPKVYLSLNYILYLWDVVAVRKMLVDHVGLLHAAKHFWSALYEVNYASICVTCFAMRVQIWLKNLTELMVKVVWSKVN